MFPWRIFVSGALLVSAVGVNGENRDLYKKEKNLMLWDLTHYCISKARDIQFEEKLDTVKREKSRPYLEKAKQLILDIEGNYLSDEAQPPNKTCDPKPLDCSDVLKAGHTKSGPYTIWPAGKQLDVYCDMDTCGGGWTVIQRRGNFSQPIDFYRDWKSYKYGFGNITQDFWLGNENIHLITNQSEYEIRFDLRDAEENRRFATYQTFWLGDEKSNYTLHIEGYSGDAGDSMTYHNGWKFQTKDTEWCRCARERMGAWWYDDCTDSNLNGVYQPGRNGREGITWYRWLEMVSLAGSEMKLRKKI